MVDRGNDHLEQLGDELTAKELRRLHLNEWVPPEHTGPCKGGPMDGKTITGGPVMHYAFDNTKAVHRYQWDRDKYRHQGRRNVLKNGLDENVTMRVCMDCVGVREDYLSTTCPYCGSKSYRRT